MADWKVKPLGEVCTLQRGFDLPTQDRRPGGYPLISSSGVIDTHDEGRVLGPGVVTGRSGSIGNVFYVAEDFWPLNTTLYVRDFHESDPRFVYYLLTAFDLRRYAGGTGVPTLNRNDVHSVAVQVPSSVEEQRRIVAILDEAFECIATAKANAEKNLHNARELYRNHVKSVFMRAAEDWPTRTLDQISMNLDSRRVPVTKSDRKAGEFPYYGASGIVDYVADYIFEGEALLVSEDGANLLARSTPIAFPASGRYWVNNHAHILKFDQMATQQFVEFFLESIPLDVYITGAAQPKLNQRALNSIPIPIPDSVNAQVVVVDLLERVAEQTERLRTTYERKLAALGELKRSLLHQAFSGRLS